MNKKCETMTRGKSGMFWNKGTQCLGKKTSGMHKATNDALMVICHQGGGALRT